MKKVYSKFAGVGVLLLAIAMGSCRKESTKNITSSTLSIPARNYSSTQLSGYFSLLCTISKSTGGFFPPQVARAYGYVGVATFEAVVHGIPGAISLSGQVNGLTALPVPDKKLQYNWAISSNAAAAAMIRDMFGTSISTSNLNTVDSTETANLNSLSSGISQDIIDRSVQFGKDITAAIYSASKTDGGDQSYLDPFQLPYTAPSVDYCWVPTGAVKTPVAPYWGKNRPFLLADVNNVTPTPPTTFGTDTGTAFYQHAMAVYNQVKNNTADNVAAAKFWADDPFNTCTPTGHTFNILIQLLKENNATLEKASVAFAKLSIAENDAFISCWKVKYQYVLIRPVSYIKKYIDPSFTTVIGTPAFPSYASGHAYESGAGAMIFTNMFTDGSGDYNFTDYSQLQYGFTARNYNNFSDMALECANSRYYAGIHYNEDDMVGLNMGKSVGTNVNNMIVWPYNTK